MGYRSFEELEVYKAAREFRKKEKPTYEINLINPKHSINLANHSTQLTQNTQST